MTKAAARAQISDVLTRLVVAGLWLFLCAALLSDYRRTGHLTGLLFLVSEGLVVVFTLLRRQSSIVDRSMAAVILTAVSVVGPPLLRPSPVPGILPDVFTAVISGIGMVVVIAGKFTLGRSFGLIPANRGVVSRGPYGIVRHPIYLGYVISHAAFMLANPTFTNIILVFGSDAALIARALVEERVLRGDERYRDYCQRVSWHLVPGVF
jgi:protein-S-isoprenylcysteine O-methyltransferase Ste14